MSQTLRHLIRARRSWRRSLVCSTRIVALRARFRLDWRTVQVGQVVCIVEAMKVFNEIKSEISGWSRLSSRRTDNWCRKAKR